MMKLMPVISDFYYVRASLIVWRINGLSRIKNIDSDAGEKLCSLIDLIENEHYPIVLDCRGIVTITDGALSSFFKKIIDSDKEVHFVECDVLKPTIRSLYDEFKSEGDSVSLSDFSERIIIHQGNYKLKLDKLELSSIVKNKLNDLVKDIVKGSFIPNTKGSKTFQPLSSTPILATGQYDASLIISDPNKFTWICLRMSDLVEDLIIENKLVNSQLLSVSLRASPFANAVSLLLNIQMRTIDHLGPFQKVWDFESFDRYSFPNTNYIFIGDFIVGGTEMKLAHLFAKYCQSDLKYAVAIGTLLDNSRFQRYHVCSLVPMKGLHKSCEYKLFS